MTTFSSFIDDDLRRAVRRQVGLTVPAAHVDEVVDIALHAATQSLDALQRVAFDAHPDQRVAICASTLAISLVQHRLQVLKECAEKVAADAGMSVHHGTVSVQR